VVFSSISSDQFTEEKINDPRIIEYSRKVEVIPEPELDKRGPEFRHAIIADVKTKDGRTFTERVDTAKGSDKRPMSTDEVIHKYTMLASRVLGQVSMSSMMWCSIWKKFPMCGSLPNSLWPR
jgi:2-methylcitrate dehydratase PrpD